MSASSPYVVLSVIGTAALVEVIRATLAVLCLVVVIIAATVAIAAAAAASRGVRPEMGILSIFQELFVFQV